MVSQEWLDFQIIQIPEKAIDLLLIAEVGRAINAKGLLRTPNVSSVSESTIRGL